MKEIDEVVTAMLNAVKQSEENYAREQEQVRARDEQLRSVTDRSDFNYLTLANSPQSEMIMQDQTNQGYTSTQTQFDTSTPLRPMERINMNHPTKTQ